MPCELMARWVRYSRRWPTLIGSFFLFHLLALSAMEGDKKETNVYFTGTRTNELPSTGMWLSVKAIAAFAAK